MLKKMFLVFLLILAFFIGSYHLLEGEKPREFIEENSEKSWAPAALYYLGIVYLIVQKNDRAERKFEMYIEEYPEEKHYQEALYNYYNIASKQVRHREAVERGRRYMEEFPDSSRAKKVEVRLKILGR
ncbi:MAG: tetratricopeptide repeat protein [Elusimicrobiota bacterium]